jgi:hypothetical protein
MRCINCKFIYSNDKNACPKCGVSASSIEVKSLSGDAQISSPAIKSSDHTVTLSQAASEKPLSILTPKPSHQENVVHTSNTPESFGSILATSDSFSLNSVSYNDIQTIDVDKLFSDTYTYLSTFNDSNYEEILSFNELTRKRSSDDCTVLFEMILEEIINPGAKQYVDTTENQVTKIIEDEELRDRMLEMAQSVEKGSFFSLRAAKKKVDARKEKAKTNLETFLQEKPATWYKKFLAIILDSIFSAIITFLLSSIYLYRESSLFKKALSVFVLPETSQLTYLIGLCIAFFPLVFVAVHSIQLARYQRTLGMKCLKLSNRGIFGDSLTVSQILSRSLLMPLSTLTFGWVPSLFGKSTFPEYFSNTKTVENKEDYTITLKHNT